MQKRILIENMKFLSIQERLLKRLILVKLKFSTFTSSYKMFEKMSFDTILIPILPLENNQDENLSNIIDK